MTQTYQSPSTLNFGTFSTQRPPSGIERGLLNDALKAEDPRRRVSALWKIDPSQISLDQAKELCEALFDVDAAVRRLAAARLSNSAVCAPYAAL